MDTGFNLFSLFQLFFGIVFTVILVSFILRAVKGVIEWRKNQQSPQVSVPAIVKSKRYKVRVVHREHYHSRNKTTYHATFEFESGDRQEFRIPYMEYDQLVENDIGMVTFKGTRYLGFEKNRN